MLTAAHDDDGATTMPQKVIETPYPLIDSDPHAARVIRYFRLSDYAVVAGGTAAFPTALYLWGEWASARSAWARIFETRRRI